MDAKRDVVYKQLTEGKDACVPLIEVLNNTDLVQELEKEDAFHMDALKKNYKVC